MKNFLLVVVPKKPRIPIKAVETFISILVESGVISLASVVIPSLFDKGSLVTIILGIILTIVFWAGAMIVSWVI